MDFTIEILPRGRECLEEYAILFVVMRASY